MMAFPVRWLNTSRGCVMNSQVKEYLKVFGSDLEQATYRGDVSGEPFVRYTDRAYQVAAGVAVILEMVMVNHLDFGDDEKPLNGYEEGSLLSLARTSLQLLVSDAEHLKTWSDLRLKEGSHE